MALVSDEAVHWTEPYILLSTKEPGMTASVRLSNAAGVASYVLALDNSLINLSRITSSMKIGERGRMSLLTPEGRIVGVPKDPLVQNDDDIRKFVLKRPADAGLWHLAQTWELWNSSDRPFNKPLPFVREGEDWLATFMPIRLGRQDLVIVARGADPGFPARLAAAYRTVAGGAACRCAGDRSGFRRRRWRASSARLWRNWRRPVAALRR